MARKPGADRMGGGRVSSGGDDGKVSGGRGAANGMLTSSGVSAADSAERRELWRELGLDDSDDESVGEVKRSPGGGPPSSPRRFVAVGGRGKCLGPDGASPAAKDIRGGGANTPLSKESEATFKPKFERGARVYAAWWPEEDAERASSPSWYPGTVKDYEEIEVDVDESQLVCTYSISFDDGDELEGLEQSHLMTKEDYLQWIKKEIKPIFEKGDEVYSAWWADDKRTAATPKWYPGVVTKVHKSTHGATEFGPSMYYDVRFDDGDELDAIPESHVFNKEDYLLTMRFSKDGGEPKFIGVRNVTDKESVDTWATLVGWYVASINGEDHPFSFLSDALRAYDAHVISVGGSVKKSHLNLPEEHFSDPKSPPKAQQKPKAKKMTSRKSRRISAATQSKLRGGSRVYVHQCKDGSKYKATVKKVGPGDTVKVHYDGMKKTSFYDVSLDVIKGFVEDEECAEPASEGNESKSAPSPAKSAPVPVQFDGGGLELTHQTLGSTGDNVKLLFELACQAVASKDTGDFSLEENTQRLLAASNRILTKALGMYKEKHEANAAKLLSNTELFEAFKASLMSSEVAEDKEQHGSPVASTCAVVEAPPSSTRASKGVGTGGSDFKVSVTVSNDRVGKGLVCAALAKKCLDSIVSEPSKGDAPVVYTGRWTAEEHRVFLQGLEQHGKEWQKIAAFVKSRSVEQVRTHAQKYFKKLAKAAMQAKANEAKQKLKLKQVSVKVTLAGSQVGEEVLAASVPERAVELKRGKEDEPAEKNVESSGEKQHSQPEGSGALPDGWEELTLPSTGRKFYLDHTNKTTSWERPTGSDDSEPSCIRGGGGESDMAEAEAEMKRQMWYARRGVVLPRSSGQHEPTRSTAVDKAAASSLKAELERAHAGKRQATLSRMEQEAEHNTGRWTAEEHRLFLQGLEQHGEDWKKVATIVKSRTAKQVATHARKSVVELKQTNEKQATKTKQTHEVCDEQQSPEGSDTLPEGWEELTDPSTERKFYVDHANEATTWERPTRSFSNSAEEEVVEKIQHRGQFSQGACGEDLAKECAEVAEQFADSIEEPSSKRLKATGVAQQPNAYGPVAFAGNSGAAMGMYPSRLDFLASASHFHYGCPMAPSRPMAFVPPPPMAFMPPQPWTMNMANHYPMFQQGMPSAWPDSAFRQYGVREQWKAMGEETSGVYLDPYEEDKKRYEVEMKAYEEDKKRYEAAYDAACHRLDAEEMEARKEAGQHAAAKVQQVKTVTKKKAATKKRATKKKHERKQQTRVFRGHVDIAQKAQELVNAGTTFNATADNASLLELQQAQLSQASTAYRHAEYRVAIIDALQNRRQCKASWPTIKKMVEATMQANGEGWKNYAFSNTMSMMTGEGELTKDNSTYSLVSGQRPVNGNGNTHQTEV